MGDVNPPKFGIARTDEMTELPSVRKLQRTDGITWATTLARVLADTFGAPEGGTENLEHVSNLVSLLLDEVRLHPLPSFVVHARPKGSFTINPVFFAATMASHRAERLIQAVELAAGALDALESGALQLSAVAARALFELAVVCEDLHQPMLEPWRKIHGSVARVRAAANSANCETFNLVWTVRNGTRYYPDDHGWEHATSVLSRLNRFSKRYPAAKDIYDMLCDATHPNIESHATLWRTQYADIGEVHGIRFEPGRSNSKIKLYIVEAIRLSLSMIILFLRDLWWVAADVTNMCNVTPNDHTVLLGLPARTKRNELCSCNSGQVTRVCTHPEPEELFKQ